MQFSPHILVALRQSFAKRDKTWRDQMVVAWQDLLKVIEPKQGRSLQWQWHN
jgi:DNA/RNA-binding domain of Phe-tRNA-synthetase-like protein